VNDSNAVARNKYNVCKEKVVLVGGTKAQRISGVTVRAGVHTWPFTFQVPSNIPSSFPSHPRVSVRYYIYGKADIPQSKSPDDTIEVIILGQSKQQPNLLNPLLISNSKKNFKMSCSLNMGGARAGDNLSVNVNIENDGSKKVRHVIVSLIENWQKTVDKKNYSEKVLRKVYTFTPNSFPLERGNYQGNFVFQIPGDAAPSYLDANAFSLKHNVTVDLIDDKAPNVSGNTVKNSILRVDLPVFILYPYANPPQNVVSPQPIPTLLQPPVVDPRRLSGGGISPQRSPNHSPGTSPIPVSMPQLNPSPFLQAPMYDQPRNPSPQRRPHPVQQGGFVTPQQGGFISPQQGGFVTPQQGGFVTPQQGYYPSQPGFAPQGTPGQFIIPKQPQNQKH